ncbi:hypothetical protein ACOMHN_027020 [Nucella lapillus]
MTLFAFPIVALCLILTAFCFQTRAAHNKHSQRLDTRAWRLLTGQRLPGHRPAEQRGVRGAFESDMRLTSQQMSDLLRLRLEGQQDLGGRKGRVKRKAVAHPFYLWPSSIVPYRFNPDFPESHKETVLKAMQFWQDSTCVQFVPVSDTLTQYLRHLDHVLFTVGEGCQSSIGRVSTGEQTTEIADPCNEFGSVAHELGHVLGFYHEQSRPDRDNYVFILRQNILQRRHHNFLKYSSNEIMTEEPYDIGSVMHYGPTQDLNDVSQSVSLSNMYWDVSLVWVSLSDMSWDVSLVWVTLSDMSWDVSLVWVSLSNMSWDYFSKDGLSLTIDTPDESFRAVMGQREAPSFIDVKTVNNMYNCSDKCSELPCRNMGYVGPGCTCVCPRGLTGTHCTEVEPSSHECGGVLTSATGVLQSPGLDDGVHYDNDMDCFWLLQGPYVSRPATVTLSIETFEVEDDVIQPCAFDWLEVRTLGPHLNGQRFCGEGPTGTVVYHSRGSGLVVHFHSDDSFTFGGFKLRYFIHLDSTS